MSQFSDPRSKDWLFLERPPYIVIIILILYLILIKYGPKFMEKREPFELKYVMTIYNLIQVVSPFFLIPYVSLELFKGWKTEKS